jgi:hypothetical protein
LAVVVENAGPVIVVATQSLKVRGAAQVVIIGSSSSVTVTVCVQVVGVPTVGVIVQFTKVVPTG